MTKRTGWEANSFGNNCSSRLPANGTDDSWKPNKRCFSKRSVQGKPLLRRSQDSEEWPHVSTHGWHISLFLALLLLYPVFPLSQKKVWVSLLWSLAQLSKQHKHTLNLAHTEGPWLDSFSELRSSPHLPTKARPSWNGEGHLQEINDTAPRLQPFR